METIRAFIAIPLPGPVLDELTALQHRLERRVPSRSVRWVRPEGIHLTLKFLGEVGDGQVSAVCEAVKQTAARHGPFELQVGQAYSGRNGGKRPVGNWHRHSCRAARLPRHRHGASQHQRIGPPPRLRV